MVGLVRHLGGNPFALTQSHQVLAYAYEIDGDAIAISVYDPNWPERADVGLNVRREGLLQSTGESLFGLLSLS